MLTMPQLTHVIAFLLLLSRIGDIGSTYLITPTLKLEANPIVRRLKWRFAIATLLMAAVPYYSLPAGVTLLITSLLVCASNCSRIWIARTLGEAEYHLFLVRVARRAPVGLSIMFFLLSPLCMATIGGLIWLFYPDCKEAGVPGSLLASSSTPWSWVCTARSPFFGSARKAWRWRRTTSRRLQRIRSVLDRAPCYVLPRPASRAA
jgi:hypothetical protein